MSETYAILTGDVIGSRKLSATELEAAFSRVKELWQTYGKHHDGSVVGTLEVFRGDGWQVALSKPYLAVEAAVFLRAAFRVQAGSVRLDSRVGLGLGSVEKLQPERLRESNGQAFQRSGAALEALTKKTLRWHIDPGENKALFILSSLTLPLMDLLVQRWTQAESAAVLGSLLGWTQDTIAAHPLAKKKDGTQPTRQAIQDALKRIGWTTHWEPVLDTVSSQLKEVAR